MNNHEALRLAALADRYPEELDDFEALELHRLAGEAATHIRLSMTSRDKVDRLRGEAPINVSDPSKAHAQLEAKVRRIRLRAERARNAAANGDSQGLTGVLTRLMRQCDALLFDVDDIKQELESR